MQETRQLKDNIIGFCECKNCNTELPIYISNLLEEQQENLRLKTHAIKLFKELINELENHPLYDLFKKENKMLLTKIELLRREL